MTKPKIWIYNAADASGDSYRRMQEKGYDVTWKPGPWDADLKYTDPRSLLFDNHTVAAAGLANRTDIIDDLTFSSAPDLRIVAKYSNGFDNVDLDAANRHGVLITHSPTEANWGGVAEGVFAYILTMLKKVREKDRNVKSGGWRDPSLFGSYLGARISDGYPGLTIGIIGLGRIGCRLADLFQPWRVRIVAYDPYIPAATFAQHNVHQVELQELLQVSDIVTLHCNLTDETRNIIDADALAKMKSTGILVNAARGPCVNTEALVYALEKGHISGAVIDALTEEPPAKDSELLNLGDKILLSPHMVTACHKSGLIPAIPWVEDNIYSALVGEVPKNIVNLEALAKWKERFLKKCLL